MQHWRCATRVSGKPVMNSSKRKRMSGIIVEEAKQTSVEEQRIEFVERKGTGHPDSICDAIMENVSIALCREYLAAYGRILHYNVDKGIASTAARICRRLVPWAASR